MAKKKTLQLQERKAVVAYFRAHYYSDIVSLLSDRTLEWLIATTAVREFNNSTTTTTSSTTTDNTGSEEKKQSSTIIYQEGTPSDICTLILSGSLTVIVGKDDKFQTEMGPWSVLALQALMDKDFTPDFTAFVSSNTTATTATRLLCIDRETFQAAIAATAEEELQRKKELNNIISSEKSESTTTNGYQDRAQMRSNLLAAFQQVLIGNTATTGTNNNINHSKNTNGN